MKLEFECWPIDENTPRNEDLWMYWPYRACWLHTFFHEIKGIWWEHDNRFLRPDGQPTHWAYTIPGPQQESR